MKQLLFISALLCSLVVYSQEWTLKLSSNVELRSWKLTTTAAKSEKSLGGAAITLYKGSAVIGQTTSDANGDFVIDVPSHGDFILTISFAGCNTKKFYVSTNGVPDAVGKDNYNPTVVIGGFVMSKPLKGVDYIGLNEPLVKVEYKSGGQNFDKDEIVTNKGLEIVSKIYDAETSVIQKFCSANKSGDEALKKNNCPLAKTYYQKAIDLLPGEEYPLERLKKVEECLEKKKQEEIAAAEASAQKAEALRIAQEKAKAEKDAKLKQQIEKPAEAKKTKEATQAKVATNDKPIIKESSSESTNEKSGSVGSSRNSKYSVKHVLGADKYKEAISKADNYFKTKRYKEARHAYEDALRVKQSDNYAQAKINEIDKMLGTQKK